MFSDQRMPGFEKRPYNHKGEICKLVPDYEPPREEDPTKIWFQYRKTNMEPFEADPQYVKKMKPKYIKFNDGHREKYDPTKHC